MDRGHVWISVSSFLRFCLRINKMKILTPEFKKKLSDESYIGGFSRQTSLVDFLAFMLRRFLYV